MESKLKRSKTILNESGNKRGAYEKEQLIKHLVKKTHCNRHVVRQFTYEVSCPENLRSFFEHGLQLENTAGDIDMNQFTFLDLCQVLNVAETMHRKKEITMPLHNFLLKNIPKLMRKKLQEKEDDLQSGSSRQKSPSGKTQSLSVKKQSKHKKRVKKRKSKTRLL